MLSGVCLGLLVHTASQLERAHRETQHKQPFPEGSGPCVPVGSVSGEARAMHFSTVLLLAVNLLWKND